MWPGHHGQWQISNINYRNLFCCHVCIAVACLPPGGTKTPKSRLQTHLLYLIWVLCSSLLLSPSLSQTVALSAVMCVRGRQAGGLCACGTETVEKGQRNEHSALFSVSVKCGTLSLSPSFSLSPGSNLRAKGRRGGGVWLLSSVEPNEFYDELLRLVVRCGCCWFTFVLFACQNA